MQGMIIDYIWSGVVGFSRFTTTYDTCWWVGDGGRQQRVVCSGELFRWDTARESSDDILGTGEVGWWF